MHFSEGIENTLQMFATEQQFESHIRSLISEKIISKSPNLMLLQNKDVVDIIICKNSVLPQLFFIEAKFHTSTKNRIGFGDGRGGGFQPEILSKRPIFFDNYMRWVFGRENDLNYYIMTNEEAPDYFCGGSIGQKQNNFQPKLFDSVKRLPEEDFIEYLRDWIQ